MLGLNYLPLMHVWHSRGGSGNRVGAFALAHSGRSRPALPSPSAGRPGQSWALAPISEGHIRIGTHAFFTWWALANLQMLFSRLPMLEEFIRLVPGLYSFWLRLWGARIGRLTYWGAGLRILDRSFLQVGDDVIFGAAVRLNPHVLARNESGDMELILASIVVGDRSVVGGYSLLTAGTELAADECTRAFLVSPPFSRWQDGRAHFQSGGPFMIWDLHVHIAGVGSQEQRQLTGPGVSTKPCLPAVYAPARALPPGMVNVPDCDQRIARFIVDQLNASEVDRAVLLAFDAAYGDDGSRDDEHTLMVADNDFVADLASTHKKVLFGASIHPYRRDALAELERLIESRRLSGQVAARGAEHQSG